MIRIEGDDLITVTSAQDWSNTQNGNPGLRITVEASSRLRGLIYDLERMHDEWRDMKKMIDSNPAIKVNWQEFQTLLELAKEQNE